MEHYIYAPWAEVGHYLRYLRIEKDGLSFGLYSSLGARLHPLGELFQLLNLIFSPRSLCKLCSRICWYGNYFLLLITINNTKGSSGPTGDINNTKGSSGPTGDWSFLCFEETENVGVLGDCIL